MINGLKVNRLNDEKFILYSHHLDSYSYIVLLTSFRTIFITQKCMSLILALLYLGNNN